MPWNASLGYSLFHFPPIDVDLLKYLQHTFVNLVHMSMKEQIPKFVDFKQTVS